MEKGSVPDAEGEGWPSWGPQGGREGQGPAPAVVVVVVVDQEAVQLRVPPTQVCSSMPPGEGRAPPRDSGRQPGSPLVQATSWAVRRSGSSSGGPFAVLGFVGMVHSRPQAVSWWAHSGVRLAHPMGATLPRPTPTVARTSN